MSADANLALALEAFALSIFEAARRARSDDPGAIATLPEFLDSIAETMRVHADWIRDAHGPDWLPEGQEGSSAETSSVEALESRDGQVVLLRRPAPRDERGEES